MALSVPHSMLSAMMLPKKVLERRMQDGHLDMGRMVDQVENLTDTDLKDKEAITAGFPCPDIAMSGKSKALAAQDQVCFGSSSSPSSRQGIRAGSSCSKLSPT